MTLYPRHIEEKIGFDQIRALVKEYCQGTLGASFADKMRFSDRPDVIRRLTSQVDEFMKIMRKGEDFPSSNYYDISPGLEKARIQGTFLTEDEFFELKGALQTLLACLHFFNTQPRESYPYLRAAADQVTADPQLLREIEQVIDERGKVRNNASPELMRIRQQLASQEMSLSRRLDSMMRNLRTAGYAKEDAQPTIRDGRMVVPVMAEHKRHVKGMVHDASSSGQTIYMEPEELVMLNNEIKDLQLRERYEIIRILTRLTDHVRPHIENLLKANQYLGIMDFVRAKSLFAQDIRAVVPEWEEQPIVNWYRAMHPLLFLHHQKQQKTVVSQRIRLDEENRLLIISGPNAGGKSIALKTVGLIQYMFQSGMAVPVSEGSKMGLFRKIFIDMGDEQSIENDLSTYSSHLTNMRFFLERADQRTLVLIDEFGAGTDPELGGAMAEAILEQLNRQKAMGVITTHYSNLKFFADRTPGTFNGSMRYDVEHLKPLYELETGTPGSSFALEIAQNIGLPQNVINQARNRIGTKKVSIENLLRDLESEKKKLEERNKQLAEKETELNLLRQRYQIMKEHLEANKRDLLRKAKLEAQNLLATANQKIENTIREIRENKAEKDRTRQLRQELEEVRQVVQLTPEETDTSLPEALEAEEGIISVGDFVKVKESNAIGEVVALGGRDATIMIGELKSNVRLNRLIRLNRKSLRQEKRVLESAPSVHSPSHNIRNKLTTFSPSIDLRGKRAEEVIPLLDDFIDSAILIGQHHLTILHGKGDGVLRELVRSHLRRYREVASMTDEHADRGGAGITLVTLKD